jgi:hypothetical protein
MGTIRDFRYSCRDGFCGADDCERCRPGCTEMLASMYEDERGAEIITRIEAAERESENEGREE